MKRLLLLAFLLTAAVPFFGQNVLEEILKQNRATLAPVIDSLDQYEVQIIYTQVDRDEKNNPHLTTYKFNVDADHYFYPASTVKFPASILSLEKLHKLNKPGLTKETPLKIDSAFSGQSRVLYDSTSDNLFPSIGHYIKKILLVSDNDAQARLYEFLGQQYHNERLHELGYKNVCISQRLSILMTPEENKNTNPFTFYSGDKVIYQQPAQRSEKDYKIDLPSANRGKGYYRYDKFWEGPMDFRIKNYFALEEQQKMLIALVMPQLMPENQRFDISKEDREFLLHYMATLPREGDVKAYHDYKEYNDSYCKYFMYGDTRDTIPSNIRIFNKIGQSYGFLTDNAYIVDFDKNIEFFLSAVVYTNKDQIFNDDVYEYDAIGFPFLANLGKAVYNYEAARERKVKPDLSEFKKIVENKS